MVLSPAACPTPSSEHNHEEGFASIVSSTTTVFQLCCLDTGAQLQDERWMSQTECGHLGDLLASSHMADFFDESRGQEQQAKTSMSTRCSGRGGGVEDTTPNVCHTPFLTPLIICSICCWHTVLSEHVYRTWHRLTNAFALAPAVREKSAHTKPYQHVCCGASVLKLILRARFLFSFLITKCFSRLVAGCRLFCTLCTRCRLMTTRVASRVVASNTKAQILSKYGSRIGYVTKWRDAVSIHFSMSVEAVSYQTSLVKLFTENRCEYFSLMRLHSKVRCSKTPLPATCLTHAARMRMFRRLMILCSSDQILPNTRIG